MKKQKLFVEMDCNVFYLKKLITKGPYYQSTKFVHLLTFAVPITTLIKVKILKTRGFMKLSPFTMALWPSKSGVRGCDTLPGKKIYFKIKTFLAMKRYLVGKFC